MAPTLYRIILQVDNLDRAEEFYGKPADNYECDL